MAGLLGDSFDDPRTSAIMALSGGLLSGNFGAGLVGANQAYAQAQNDAMKRKYVDMQVQDMAQQAELRKQQAAQLQRQQEMQNAFLFGGGIPGGGGAPSAPSGGMGAGPAAPQGAGYIQPQGGAGGLIQQARQMGIPEQAIQADVAFNGGKGIAEMLFKRGVPDMQVTNGYAYDKNRLGAGYLPQLNTSQDGKTSMVQIGPDGMPVVSAPTGALDTFARYQNVQEGTKANYDPLTVTPQGENPQMTTRGALVRNPQVSGRVTPQEQAIRDQGRVQILQQEVQKATQQLNDALSRGDQSAAARAQTDLAALNRELGGRRPSIGLPLQSEEEKQRAAAGVTADAKRNEALTVDAQKSKDTLANIKAARTLLQKGPTSSGIGSMVDSAANFFGKSTEGADVASQLDTLSGWMVNNVPRMEGPQSNFDVQNYKTMAGLVGDRTKPLSQRLAALQTLEDLQQKYAALNSGGNQVNTGGATGSFEAPANLPKPMKGMVRNGYRFKGGDPASPSSWEKM